jgi:6-phosphogluconolactonase
MVNLNRRLLAVTLEVCGIASSVGAVASVRAEEIVFVISNNAERNQVIAFEREGRGNFFELGRFDTLGRGSGGVNDPLESQGALTLSPDHTLLFAANAGSGDITVFRVAGDRLFITDKEPSVGSELDNSSTRGPKIPRLLP